MRETASLLSTAFYPPRTRIEKLSVPTIPYPTPRYTSSLHIATFTGIRIWTSFPSQRTLMKGSAKLPKTRNCPLGFLIGEQMIGKT